MNRYLNFWPRNIPLTCLFSCKNFKAFTKAFFIVRLRVLLDKEGKKEFFKYMKVHTNM